MGATLFDKVWNEHVVDAMADGVALLHIDRHLLHDLNGVGGFREMTRLGYRVRNPELVFATPDHAISTELGRDTDRSATGARYVKVLREECLAWAEAGCPDWGYFITNLQAREATLDFRHECFFYTSPEVRASFAAWARSLPVPRQGVAP